MMKMLVFDMDGTIADLYAVDGWLTDLIAENPRPYIEAEAIYSMTILNDILLALKADGWRIAVTTWLSKDSTREYDNMVRKAKKEWLDKYEFPYDELHMVKYGTRKADCTRAKGGFQILIDDNEEVRKTWHLGSVIDATENILEKLVGLLVD